MQNSPAQNSVEQIVKSQLVEIPIAQNATVSKWSFPTQDFLRQKYIVGIETFDVTDLPLAPISGNALITAANLKNAFLSLYEMNPEPVDAQGIDAQGQGFWNDLIPLITLHRIQNVTPDPFTRRLAFFTPRIIYWEKSNVQLANGASLGNSGGAVSFIFQVYYIGNGGDVLG